MQAWLPSRSPAGSWISDWVITEFSAAPCDETADWED